MFLEYATAQETSDFVAFQRIGDWILWSDIVVPQSFEGVNEVVESIGRRSYVSCHRIMRGRWLVFEELADRLPTIARHARHMLV